MSRSQNDLAPTTREIENSNLWKGTRTTRTGNDVEAKSTWAGILLNSGGMGPSMKHRESAIGSVDAVQGIVHHRRDLFTYPNATPGRLY